ncbi:E3 ubiquitin-protein ligase [Arachis hypogaea]|nr:E3 ubiquitin-protein ligase [Arachis hypogaea]
MEVELKQLMADLQSLNQSLPDPSLHASLLKDVCLSSTRVALEFYRVARDAILLYEVVVPVKGEFYERRTTRDAILLYEVVVPVKIVALLLENGADVNSRNYCGQTDLMQACRYGHWEVVQTLMLFRCNSARVRKHIRRIVGVGHVEDFESIPDAAKRATSIQAIPSYSARRSLFEHYVKTRVEEERKEKRAAQKAAIEGFKQLLDEASEESYTHRLEATTQKSQQSREAAADGSTTSIVDPDAVWRETALASYKNCVYGMRSFFTSSLRTLTLRPSLGSATSRAVQPEEGMDLRL